jgi:hypothetical protein
MLHLLAAVLAPPIMLPAQPGGDLAPFFGFAEQRTIVVDDGCGPVISADFNADGRPDLAIVNNAKSRIEIHYLRAEERTPEEAHRAFRANELRPNPWYDRVEISVAHRVTALRAFDADHDGLLDIIYAGSNPLEIIVLRQTDGARFETHARKRVRELATTQSGFRIADVTGDPSPEIVTLVEGRVTAFGLTRAGLIADGAPIGAGTGVVAIFCEDVDGDSRVDLIGVVPDNESPLRMWLRADSGELGAELRFEMPPLIEVQPIRFPDREAVTIGVIERTSRRMVFYDLTVEAVDELAAASVGSERDAQAEVVAFPGTGVKDRSIAIGDVDADGRPDLVATDPKANALILYHQGSGDALAGAESFSTFKSPRAVSIGQWTGSTQPEIFVLSEEEKTVGISDFDEKLGRIEFPVPHSLSTPGASPVMMGVMSLAGAPSLALVVKDKRDYVLEIHRNVTGDPAEAEISTFQLENVRRDPGAVLGADINQDGHDDVLVLTPGEPMIAILADAATGVPSSILTKDTMPQFGLVQGAGPYNTALFDMDGDGTRDLLIADANFVRACVFDTARGWRVIDQVNADSPSAQLVGLTLMEHAGETLVVGADSANNRLIFFARDDEGQWGVRHRIRVLGFPAGRVASGRFAGESPGILAFSDDGFAIVRLSGERAALEQVAAYRPDAEDRLEHEMEAGDVNGDGYVDAVVLDAKEQMCAIFTFSSSRKLYEATEFEIFESRLFQRGNAREFEPSSALIADLTGDGADDVALVVHDRVIIYPQMTEQTLR